MDCRLALCLFHGNFNAAWFKREWPQRQRQGGAAQTHLLVDRGEHIACQSIFCRVLRVECDVLKVSARGISPGTATMQAACCLTDEALLTHMRAIHAEVQQEYGWPRMHKKLLARSMQVGKKRVRHLMQQHDLRGKTKRKVSHR